MNPLLSDEDGLKALYFRTLIGKIKQNCSILISKRRQKISTQKSLHLDNEKCIFFQMLLFLISLGKKDSVVSFFTWGNILKLLRDYTEWHFIEMDVECSVELRHPSLL